MFKEGEKMKTFIYWLKDIKNDTWLDAIGDVIHTCICSWAKCKKETYYCYVLKAKKTACKRCGYWSRSE
ncbi:hypothetical protein AN957_19015 [Cytobacillus solani]|uniref:Uncharacterized protein n=1 Tax=Cytobacillus solani TaxID=1637975 RepID=A0A0Q3VI83_9BACI|nr:hypothetical protein AN957_19015 [Cytobacillus solani]